ncbi:MAG: hypothetical protein K9K32_06985 [Halanaerobiales bacterium]|nr:hypothetical protein [Halanaerobiales bacterium]
MNYFSILKYISQNQKIYIVGGFIRDHLLGLETKDIDLVVIGDIKKTVDIFTKNTKSKKVILDSKRNIYRVVTKDSKFIDFSAPVGQDIIDDLGHRDFTINSIACLISDLKFCNKKVTIKQSNLIDPFNGTDDLKNKEIRILNNNTLKDDPIRILRAHRFSNRYNFDFDKRTKIILKNEKNLLKTVKEERIKEELIKLLNFVNINRFEEFLIDSLFTVIFNINTYKNKGNIKKCLSMISKQNENTSQKKIKNYLLLLIKLFLIPLLQKDILLNEIKFSLSKYTFSKKDIYIVIKYLTILSETIRNYELYYNNDELIYNNLYKEDLDIYLLNQILNSFYKCNDQVEIYNEKVLNIIKSLKTIKKRVNQLIFDGTFIKETLNIKEGIVIGRYKKLLKKEVALGKVKSKKEAKIYLKKLK